MLPIQSSVVTPLQTETPPTIQRLEDQIAWYDRKAASHQGWYKRLKVLTIVSAALIPVIAAAKWDSIYSAALGIIIVIAEGMLQLNQFQTNWLTYRSTCEALKHEKYLYLAQAGPYAGADKPVVVLAERTESLISQEHAKWVSLQDQSRKTLPPITSEPRV